MLMDGYMYTILTREPCKKHNALLGDPCWVIYPDSSKLLNLMGVCGPRTRKAGFIGTSNPASLRAKSIRRTKQN